MLKKEKKPSNECKRNILTSFLSEEMQHFLLQISKLYMGKTKKWFEDVPRQRCPMVFDSEFLRELVETEPTLRMYEDCSKTLERPR